ncbi:MAG TPA: sugar phosphate isomerase/epimerase family protein [Gemmatimonadaceae bacterium]|nr:sugar phosphate isomerase/epimerase family protein [Gemmatimonadaceae bacterium]
MNGDDGMDRRGFLRAAGAMAAIAASGCARPATVGSPTTATAAAGGVGRLPLGFSTLGSPKWTWTQTLDFAAANGFAGIELRGIQETMDLSKRAEFQPDRVAQTKRELVARGLTVPCLGASVNLHEQDAAKLGAAMAETRRFIDVASALGAPYVRVFGNQYVQGMSREAVHAYVARGLRELGEYARPRGVTVLLESHGDFVTSPALVELMRLADSPAVGILWDAHHTFVAKEATETSVAQLGPWIRHTHLKDSVPAGNGRKYVLTGRGEVPVKQQIEALARTGYKGFYSLEWEKRWHPELDEPEVAFADFAKVASGYLRDAGVKPIASR